MNFIAQDLLPKADFMDVCISEHNVKTTTLEIGDLGLGISRRRRVVGIRAPETM